MHLCMSQCSLPSPCVVCGAVGSLTCSEAMIAPALRSLMSKRVGRDEQGEYCMRGDYRSIVNCSDFAHELQEPVTVMPGVVQMVYAASVALQLMCLPSLGLCTLLARVTLLCCWLRGDHCYRSCLRHLQWCLSSAGAELLLPHVWTLCIAHPSPHVSGAGACVALYVVSRAFPDAYGV